MHHSERLKKLHARIGFEMGSTDASVYPCLSLIVLFYGFEKFSSFLGNGHTGMHTAKDKHVFCLFALIGRKNRITCFVKNSRIERVFGLLYRWRDFSSYFV